MTKLHGKVAVVPAELTIAIATSQIAVKRYSNPQALRKDLSS